MVAATLVSRGHELPPALPGFGHVTRYWDPHASCVAAKIFPGEFYVTLHDESIVTVLGSCVSACIRDPVVGIGGMNHFMLPGDSRRSAGASDAARYGTHAMERLINELLSRGARRERLETKVFGGGRVLPGLSDIGARNAEFVLEFLTAERLKLAAQDLGDVHPRKVVYAPRTGRVLVQRLMELKNDTIEKRELAYVESLREAPIEGTVELWGDA